MPPSSASTNSLLTQQTTILYNTQLKFDDFRLYHRMSRHFKVPRIQKNQKKEITVRVINFHYIHSHIELLLEYKNENEPFYYNINCWRPAVNGWETEYNPLFDAFDNFRSDYIFKIHADPNKIVKDWYSYQKKHYGIGSIFNENCAVAVQKFLTHFADIPAPSSTDPENTSWNHVLLGFIWWPSYVPCPIMLPGRVMDNVKFHTKEPQPNDDPQSYRQKGMTVLKSIKKENVGNARNKFNDLIKFYNSLDDLRLHARELEKGSKECESVNRLLENLNTYATDYLKKDGYTEQNCKIFKDKCMQSIHQEKQTLSTLQGWKPLLANLTLAVLGVGIFYVAAACVNKAITGHFTFFSQTKTMKKIDKITTQLAVHEEKVTAINSSPLTSN